MLVKHKSVAAFMAVAQNNDYLKATEYREAALVDSRLLPLNLR